MEAYDNGEGTLEEISERFQVSVNTIVNWETLRRETGSLMPKKMGGVRDHSSERSVDAAGDEFVRTMMAELPDSSVPEVVAAYKEEFGKEVHIESMRRTLHRLGFRFKKGSAARQPRNGPMWSRNEKRSAST